MVEYPNEQSFLVYRERELQSIADAVQHTQEEYREILGMTLYGSFAHPWMNEESIHPNEESDYDGTLFVDVETLAYEKNCDESHLYGLTVKKWNYWSRLENKWKEQARQSWKVEGENAYRGSLASSLETTTMRTIEEKKLQHMDIVPISHRLIEDELNTVQNRYEYLHRAYAHCLRSA